MRRLTPLLAAVFLLALPPAASARVIELGKSDSVRPSCPSSCQAIGRVTGIQGRSGALRNPFVIRRAGYLVAFTLRLGDPTSEQINFFTDLYGGPPMARLAVLRRGRTVATRRIYRMIRQSANRRLAPYFGTTVTFAFKRALRVRRGHRIALTVPTWAPVLAHGLSSGNWWRASRRRGTCDNVTQRMHHRFHNLRRYECDYHDARLTYTATYVPDPRRAS